MGRIRDLLTKSAGKQAESQLTEPTDLGLSSSRVHDRQTRSARSTQICLTIFLLYVVFHEWIFLVASTVAQFFGVTSTPSFSVRTRGKMVRRDAGTRCSQDVLPA